MKNTSRAVLLLATCAWLVPHCGNAFYNPNTGRWVNRDPAGERGGPNLSAVLANNCVGRVDFLGLFSRCACSGALIVVTAPENARYNDPDLIRVRIEMYARYFGSPLCCHFRRWVRGYATLNGRELHFATHPALNPNEFTLDSPDNADNTSTNPYEYEGVDIPGLGTPDDGGVLQADDDVDFHLEFVYQVVDYCNLGKIVAEASATLNINGKHKRQISTPGFGQGE